MQTEIIEQMQDEPVAEIQPQEIPTEEPRAEETPTEEIRAEEPQSQETPSQPVAKGNRSPVFWSIVIGGLTCLCILIFILVALGGSRRSPEPTIPTTAVTQPAPTETTEATLPLPEANPIGLGDFAMMGGYLTCLSTRSVLGIDVSEWQGKIDWQKVRATGVEFAMIRAGYRGTEHGVVLEDLSAQTNYAGATAAGVKVGAYFFSQAVTVEEALEEANFLLSVIKDWDIEMPVVFDWEYVDSDSRTGEVDPRTLTDCTKAFCDAVAAAGYQPMVYFNISHSYDNVYLEELTGYDFWLARYDTVLDYPYKIDMWQYTETGSVPGITGNVDINLYFPWEE